MRSRAAWLSVVAYIASAMALLGLSGCVRGTPFEPEMCAVQVDTLGVVMLQESAMQLCPSTRINTLVKKEGTDE